MLRKLCDEHDREVSTLREELTSLRAAARGGSPLGGCPGDADDATRERSPLPGKALRAEEEHATAPPEADSEYDNEAASNLREQRVRESQSRDGMEACMSFESPTRSFESPTRERRAPQEEQMTEKQSKKPQAIFADVDAMKERIRKAAIKPVYNVANYYKKDGVWQHIALHPIFERMTMGVIAFNAIWIWIDTDENPADLLTDAGEIFQIMEHFFCIFFTFEWTCRFNAFARKLDCCRDPWFVFDTFLVFFMVLETWLMNTILLFGGGTSFKGNVEIVRLARLLRLSRMARMTRLFRAVPELLILIKGMLAAMRSVFFTLCLLAVIVYVFGIAFTQMVGKSLPEHFGTVPTSMHTLFLDGTLLDNAGLIVRGLEKEGFAHVAMFYTFVLLAALTVMNMLIGVLCEVVSAVAATEKEGILVAFMKVQLEKVWEEVTGEERLTGEISKEEFSMILESADACKALEEAGVDAIGLVDNIDFIFTGETEDEDGQLKDKMLSFADFVALVLSLRGSNNATVKDIVDLRKYFNSSIGKLRDELRRGSRVTTRMYQSL